MGKASPTLDTPRATRLRGRGAARRVRTGGTAAPSRVGMEALKARLGAKVKLQRRHVLASESDVSPLCLPYSGRFCGRPVRRGRFAANGPCFRYTTMARSASAPGMRYVRAPM